MLCSLIEVCITVLKQNDVERYRMMGRWAEDSVEAWRRARDGQFGVGTISN